MNDRRSLLSVRAILLAAEIQELAPRCRALAPCAALPRLELEHAANTCGARTNELRRWRGGCAHASSGWERLSQTYKGTTCRPHRAAGPIDPFVCARGD